MTMSEGDLRLRPLPVYTPWVGKVLLRGQVVGLPRVPEHLSPPTSAQPGTLHGSWVALWVKAKGIQQTTQGALLWFGTHAETAVPPLPTSYLPSPLKSIWKTQTQHVCSAPVQSP